MNESAAASPNEELQTLELWMKEYGQDVMNVAYTYVKNYHQAQDIAQDVFIRAFTKKETFRGDSSVKTWLLTITANRCRDILRSWTMKHEVHDETPLQTEVSNHDTETEALARLQRDELWSALHKLPHKYREVLVLYYMQGLTGQEVAAVLRTNDQNVRTRLHRGRTLLREILEEGGETHGAQ